MPGRKAIAPEVHKAKGTYKVHPERENKHAPPANGQEPKMPPDLSDDEREKWVQLIGDMRSMGVLSSECRELFLAYCTAYASWKEARDIIKEEGLTLQGKAGRMRHPLLVEMHKHRDVMNRLLPEFGLTPSSRGKLQSFKDSEDDPFETFVARLTGKK